MIRAVAGDLQTWLAQDERVKSLHTLQHSTLSETDDVMFVLARPSPLPALILTALSVHACDVLNSI